MDTLQLVFKIDDCPDGVDDSEDNPLSRATNRLFRLGRPFARLNKCFFLGPDGILRWLGIFVESAGDRLLFFPGYAQPQTYVLGYNGKHLRWDQSFQIDHLSLEPDRRTWHFTAPESAEHLGNLYTQQLNSGCVHWFSMSVATWQDLRVVRRETHVVAPTPARDVDRRMDAFLKSREDAVFLCVSLNGAHPLPPEPFFLNFSVIVGPKGFAPLDSKVLGVPYDSPLASSLPPEGLNGTPIRLHRVVISDEIELEILAAAIPGQLRQPVLFGGSALPGTLSVK